MTEENKNGETAVGSIIVVKLVTGEEIIGKVVDMKNGSIALEKTLAIGLQQDEQTGRVGFGFAPWGPLVVDVKYINMNHIVYAAEPKEPLGNAYKQATGDIVVPSKKLIVG